MSKPQSSQDGTRATEAFFGRRKGPQLRARQKQAMNDLLPRLRLDISEDRPSRLTDLFTKPAEHHRLEIGFGGGEHLAQQCAANPTINFMGVEPFINGMAKMLTAVEDYGLKNLRLYDDDATQLLDWLPNACLDQVDLLYPDPWPKKRHWKRRFVNQANLTRFARVLKPGGIFRFASDIDTYVNWTLTHVEHHGGFEWLAQRADDWREPWEGWTRTRYEAKAIREGRPPCYLIFQR